jgi:hypothetical protein
MVSVIWSKRAIPMYWRLLDKRGSSNLREQKALLYPVLRLLKGYEVVVLGDREFRSVRLAQWLDNQGVYFATVVLGGLIWVYLGSGHGVLSDLVNKFWQLTPNKLPYFQRGLRAMELIQSTF